MTWDKASILKIMAGSRLLIIDNHQADQAELLDPRIQAVTGKLCTEHLRTMFSSTQQCE